jgi:glutamate racemase
MDWRLIAYAWVRNLKYLKAMMDQVTSNHLPIGVFDSGIGGLTVVKQIAAKIPHEQVIYIGDTARLPYGVKSSKTIVRYSIENTLFLLDKDIKALVIACNTAASHSVEKLRQFFKLPIVDIVEAGVREAVAATENKRIAVLATAGTVKTGIYEQKIAALLPGAVVTSLACPLFVSLIEEGFAHHPAARLVVSEYLAPLKEKHIDTVVLACTHYPLLAHFIAEELGSHVNIIDPAAACAEQVASLLCAQGLSAVVPTGAHKYFVSDDPEKFGRLAETFLGNPLGSVEKFSWHF